MAARKRLLIFTVFLSAFALQLYAQEQIPDNDAVQSGDPASQERIVDGRPALYTIKRLAHPLSWIELGVKPAVGSAQSERIQNLISRKPGPVRFGLGGIGVGSGFGPSLTYVNDDFLHRGIQIQVPVVYTYSRYQSYGVDAKVPVNWPAADGKLSFDLGTRYISRARDDFYGVGNQSSRLGEEARFRSVTREVSSGFTLKLNDDWSAKFGGVYRDVGITKPTVGVSAQHQFSEASAPGLYGATIGSGVISIGRDTITRENYAFSGKADQLDLSYNQSIDGGNARYWRFRYEGARFIALTSDRRKMIAARGLFETNLTPHGRQVPFFDMPFLGSDSTLRGFDNFRFRDKSALAVSLEYRYRIWPSMDWGFFVDEGQVAPQFGDMALKQFHTGYGARLFVWPKSSLPISIDYGRSRETWRLYINFNTSF